MGALRGQTPGHLSLAVKALMQIGSGTVHSSHWYNYHRCGDGCKLITRFSDVSFQVELLQVFVLNLTLQAELKVVTL